MKRRILLPVLIQLVLVSTAFAQWQVDGMKISSSAETPSTLSLTLVPDGSGGALATWMQFDPVDSLDVFVQRIDANGYALWTPGGVRVCSAPHNQHSIDIAADGSGGAIVSWTDERLGNYYVGDVYAQRVDATGVVQWTTDGVPVCTATDVQRGPEILADGSGGAFIVWEDARTGGFDIYAQRLNATGAAMFAANGQAVCAAAGSQFSPVLASDGAGGAFIAWQDLRSDNDVYAQRINAFGLSLWTANGVGVCTVPFSPQLFPKIVADGVGGAIIAWTDGRSGPGVSDVYAQRLNASGVPQWTADGVAVCTSPALQQLSRISPTSVGGADLVWRDDRNGNSDVYAQRLTSAGTAAWTANGVAICTASGNQGSSRVVSTPTGTFVAWSDPRGGNIDLYMQKLNPSGVPEWTANGIAICAAPGDQTAPAMVSDGDSGVILDWVDTRSGSNELFAERFTDSGEQLAFLVTSTADDFTLGTLHTAIAQANATPGAQKISFNIPGAGQHTIYLTWSLPTITDELTIDGFTQPGASPNTNGVGNPCDAQIMIDIHGGFTGDGFRFQAPGTLRGLAIHSFSGRDVIVEATPVVVEGNYIGLDAGGYGGWSNQVGIWIQADGCRVGGTTPAARNVISEGPFSTIGIQIEGAVLALIVGNYIGTDPNLVNNGVGNGTGILIEGAAVLNMVGLHDPLWNSQAPNVIAYNGTGISVLGATAFENHLYGNSFRYNSTLAIDLGGDGQTPNDIGDGDNGPNQLQNFPELAAASGTQVTGTMHGAPNTTIRLDFYRSGPFYPPSGNVYLGALTVDTDGLGDAPFTFTPAQPMPPAFITATAHDVAGNTSEMSDWVITANTPAGSDVFVNLVDDNGTLRGTATFAEVYSANNTYVVHPFTPPAPISGTFSVGDPNDPATYFDVNTLADYGGGVDICLFYDENNIPGPETSLVLVHYNGSAWEDVTTSRDTVNNKICGHVSALSPFAIAVPVPTGVHDDPIPNQFALHANVPNPFNPQTTIRYDVPAGGADVSITIYDVAGRLMRSLVDEHRAAGVWSVHWNGENDHGVRVASGVYFYRMRAGSFVETRKMVLLK